VLTEVEPPLVGIFKEGRRATEQQDPSRVAAWRAEILKALTTVLEPQLGGRQYLLGDAFTLADLNVASTLAPVAMLGVNLGELPNTNAWLKRCNERDANRRALARVGR
jgi:glutathione S-transferase